MARIYGLVGALFAHCLLILAIFLFGQKSIEQIKQTIISASIISPQIQEPKPPEPKKPPQKQKEESKKQTEQKVAQHIASASSTTQNTVAEEPIQKKQEIKPIAKEEPMPPAPVVIPPNFNADYLHNPAPAYPAASRKFAEEGKVILRVLVGARGDAKKVELKISSGFDRLDRSAIEAVQNWKFVPAKKGDEAIEAWVNVPISFKLGV